MDYIKIYDTRLQNRNDKSFLEQLQIKSRKGLSKQTESIETSVSSKISSKQTSKFCFKVLRYEIGSHVEYIVEMQQNFKILGRKVTNNIQFRTRYSMLEKLNEKIRKQSFPPKKIFGNKDKIFLSKRQKQLEYFLNEISSQRSTEFLKFVKQIKQSDFNKELMKEWKLE